MNMELMNLAPEQIALASTQDLKKALSQGLTITAKQLGYLALIWTELEKRGEDLSAMQSGLAVFLPLIASDKLDSEVVVRYAGNATLLKRLMALPIEEQRRVIEEGSVPLVKISEAGEQEVENKRLNLLNASEIKQVFNSSGVTTPEQQYEALTYKTEGKKNRKAKYRFAKRVSFEHVESAIVANVGGKQVRTSVLLDDLERHYGLESGALLEFLEKNAAQDAPYHVLKERSQSYEVSNATFRRINSALNNLRQAGYTVKITLPDIAALARRQKVNLDKSSFSAIDTSQPITLDNIMFRPIQQKLETHPKPEELEDPGLYVRLRNRLAKHQKEGGETDLSLRELYDHIQEIRGELERPTYSLINRLKPVSIDNIIVREATRGRNPLVS